MCAIDHVTCGAAHAGSYLHVALLAFCTIEHLCLCVSVLNIPVCVPHLMRNTTKACFVLQCFVLLCWHCRRTNRLWLAVAAEQPVKTGRMCLLMI